MTGNSVLRSPAPVTGIGADQVRPPSGERARRGCQSAPVQKNHTVPSDATARSGVSLLVPPAPSATTVRGPTATVGWSVTPPPQAAGLVVHVLPESSLHDSTVQARVVSSTNTRPVVRSTTSTRSAATATGPAGDVATHVRPSSVE